MLAAILLMLVQDDFVVQIREPRPATPWEEVFVARCGDQRLELTRRVRPDFGAVEVSVNGRPARGDLTALEEELGRAGAYRMTFLCPQEQPVIEVRWVAGVADEAEGVGYRAGVARFSNGALTDAHAEETTEESFWFW